MDSATPIDDRASPSGPARTRTLADDELDRQADRTTADPAMPHRIGRYTIVRRLGSGGMGTVWSAYDESLDRRVAIKVLVSEQRSNASRARMLREAKALARLSDPNVVQIFEVGELGDDVFVAMEFVRGPSLRRWLEQPRELAEILDAFIQAGRGLAAVHGARLVHRDFKPDNVVVGEDGRVRLIDFGIARLVDEAPDPAETEAAADLAKVEARIDAGAVEAHADSPVGDGLDTPLDAPLERVTRTGQFIGTPAYMAPEQMRGDAVDTRADQFGYCVSLFRAVYGVAPFAGEKIGAIALNVFAGRVIDPPRTGRKVPAGLLPIIRRGLAVAPSDRFADMRELLQALERLRPRRGPRRAILVAGLAGAGIAAAIATTDRDTCDGGLPIFEQVWHRERAAAIAAEFAGNGAAASWDRAAAMLDRLRDGWVVQHRDACERHRKGEQSAQLLDRRMTCLDGLRKETDALLVELERFEPALVRIVQDAVAALPDPAACGDLERLASGPDGAPPPELAADVERALAIVRRAEAQERTGRVLEATEALRTEMPWMDSLQWPPVGIEAHAAAGRLARAGGRFADAAREFGETFRRAVGFADDRRAFEGAVSSVIAIGVQQGRFADAGVWIDVADAWLVRLGEPRFERAMWLQAVAGVREREGDLEKSHALLEQALELLRDDESVSSLRLLASTYNSIGLVSRGLRRFDEAEASYKKARELWVRLFGEDHPMATEPLNNLGSIYIDLHRPEDARRTWEEVLAARQRVFGPRHPKVAFILHNLGSAMDKLGDHAGAIGYYRQALEIFETEFGPESPEVATPSVTIGESYIELGQHAEAIPYIRKALAIDQSVFGDDHADVAWDLNALATALCGAEQFVEAEAVAARAVQIRIARASPDRVAQSRLHHAVALAGLGRLGEARAAAQQALLESVGTDHVTKAIAGWLDAHPAAAAPARPGKPVDAPAPPR